MRNPWYSLYPHILAQIWSNFAVRQHELQYLICFNFVPVDVVEPQAAALNLNKRTTHTQRRAPGAGSAPATHSKMKPQEAAMHHVD